MRLQINMGGVLFSKKNLQLNYAEWPIYAQYNIVYMNVFLY